MYVLVYGTPPTNNAAIARSTNSARSYRRFLLRTRLRPLAALVGSMAVVTFLSLRCSQRVTSPLDESSSLRAAHNIMSSMRTWTLRFAFVACDVT